MCIGKALTGGYMTLSAVLTTAHVAATIGAGEAGVFMHGPTFMANPLACAVAHASCELLLEQDWQACIARIQTQLQGLQAALAWSHVADVRVLGAIGVIELKQPVDMQRLQAQIVAHGVWLRPFGRLVYLMPPYVISESELDFLIQQTLAIVKYCE